MQFSNVLLTLAVFGAGVLHATQAPTNAMLAGPMRSPVNAALVSFAVGTGILAVLALTLRVRPDFAGVARLPAAAWLGGAYGAFFVVAAAHAAPRIGVAAVATLMVAGQIVASLTIDQMGAFGLPVRPLSPGRILGVLLILAGVVLVRRG